MMASKDMDQQDELAKFKQDFFVEKETVYLNGKSFGLMSRRSEAKLKSLMNSWKDFKNFSDERNVVA